MRLENLYPNRGSTASSSAVVGCGVRILSNRKVDKGSWERSCVGGKSTAEENDERSGVDVELHFEGLLIRLA
jgi:hypothetical protein